MFVGWEKIGVEGRGGLEVEEGREIGESVYISLLSFDLGGGTRGKGEREERRDATGRNRTLIFSLRFRSEMPV